MRRLIAALPLTLAAGPALAHVAPLEHNSFLAGATHPIFGADHVLAMVAVGLWAGMLGGRALWAVPAAFVGVMVLGFALALGGLALPLVEPAILASVVVLGLVVALGLRLPTVAGAALVGAFALFHGHAHGAEMGAAGALPYLAGFAATTAALHVLGLILGVALLRAGRAAPHVAGGLVAAAGAALAAGV
ncbi:protein hupE [Rhodosalinus halophilus]|uniref:Protein hupE n=1 Tax=Rhodosalinus halophilus TaxID=2259333 RepID=A0A365UAD8_9RHOB|nr:HupE/UreJ family protein [Rhodosalinus halophilus]RBI86183.1 protein hupE [Rhodosalinus halophilus]